MMKKAKQKVSLTHREQLAREICTRIFIERFYSKEFIDEHIEVSAPRLVPMIERIEREVVEHLVEELLKRATGCDLDKRMMHLPISESKLKARFLEILNAWRDTD